MSKEFDDPLEEHGTLLESLSKARIVEISKTEKGFRFVEECDYYFGKTLSREQMEKLIEELQALMTERKKGGVDE